MGNAADSVSVVAEGAILSGRVNGQDLVVLGRFEGILELKGRLHVGRQGFVKADVKAGAVEVEGEFEGEIKTPRLSFGETARARGVFLADRLSIRDGARVDGAMNLTPAAEQPKAPPPEASVPEKVQAAAPAKAAATTDRPVDPALPAKPAEAQAADQPAETVAAKPAEGQATAPEPATPGPASPPAEGSPAPKQPTAIRPLRNGPTPGREAKPEV